MRTMLSHASKFLALFLAFSILLGGIPTSNLIAYAAETTKEINIEATDDVKDADNAAPEEAVDPDVPFAENIEVEKEKPVIETGDYILKNINEKYAKADYLNEVDAIKVKQTFAQKSKMKDGIYTIANLWRHDYDESKGEDYGDAFVTQNESAVVMYDTDADSDYFVAYVNPMVNDSSIMTTEWWFAKNNDQGELYDDCIYDEKTGLAYIPKKYTFDIPVTIYDEEQQKEVPFMIDDPETGEKVPAIGAPFQSQVQLLQIVSSDEVQKTVKVEITSNEFQGDIEISGEGKANITDIATTVQISSDPEILKALSRDEMDIYINGLDVPWHSDDEFEDATYDNTTGTVTIPIAPSNVDSVRIDIKNGSVLSDIWNNIKNSFKSIVQGNIVHAKTAEFDGKKFRLLPFVWTYDGNISKLKGKKLVEDATSSKKTLTPYLAKTGDTEHTFNGKNRYDAISHAQGLTDAETAYRSASYYMYLWYYNKPGSVGGVKEKNFQEVEYGHGAEFHPLYKEALARYILGKSTLEQLYDDGYDKTISIGTLAAFGEDTPHNAIPGGGGESAYYGIEFPSEFDLQSGSTKVTISQKKASGWSSTEAHHLAVTNKDTGNMIAPLTCSEVPRKWLGTEATVDDKTFKVVLKILAASVDEEDGDGAILIGALLEPSKDMQSPIGVFAVSVEAEQNYVQMTKGIADGYTHLAGQPGFSVEGIKYTLYEDDKKTKAGTFTIKSSGKSNILAVDPGATYYYKENPLPEGSKFERDTNWYSLTVGDNEGKTKDKPKQIYAYNKPAMYPFSLSKGSTVANVNYAGGGYTFAGIQYAVYTDPSCAESTRATMYTSTGASQGAATLSLDANGNSNTIYLTAGTYWVKEIEVGESGFVLSPQVQSITISGPAANGLSFSNTPKMYYYHLNKISEVTKRGSTDGDNRVKRTTEPNSPYTMDGIQYTVFTQNGTVAKDFTTTNDYNNAPNAVITLDHDGNPRNLPKLLAGQYYAQETNANTARTGYVLNPNTYPFTIGKEANGTFSQDGTRVSKTASDAPVHDPIQVQKKDKDKSAATNRTPQGDASFNGIQFSVKYYNTYPTDTDTLVSMPNEANLWGTWLFQTDETGYADLCNIRYLVQGTQDLLTWADDNGKIDWPVGQYVITETKSSFGYKVNPTPIYGSLSAEGVGARVISRFVIDGRVQRLAENNKIVDHKNPVIRGGVEVSLFDMEYSPDFTENYDGATRTQGDASLKGATFGIYNNSSNPVTVDTNQTIQNMIQNRTITKDMDDYDSRDLEANYAKGTKEFASIPASTVGDESEPLLIITTNEYGYASTGRFALPTGRYTIRQLTPPEGYKRTGKTKTGVIEDVYQQEFTIGGKDVDNRLVNAASQSDHGKLIRVANANNVVVRGNIQAVKEDIEQKLTEVVLDDGILESSSAIGSKGHVNDELGKNGGLSNVEFSIWNISYKNPDPANYRNDVKSNLINAYVEGTYVKDDKWKNETFIDQDSQSYRLGKEVLRRREDTGKGITGNPNTTWSELTKNPDNGYVTTIKTVWDPVLKRYVARTNLDVGALPYGTYLVTETATTPDAKYNLSDRTVFTFQIRDGGIKTNPTNNFVFDRLDPNTQTEYGMNTKSFPNGRVVITSTGTANEGNTYVKSDGNQITGVKGYKGGIQDKAHDANNATDPNTYMSNNDLTYNTIRKYTDEDNNRTGNTLSFSRDGSMTVYNQIRRTDYGFTKKKLDATAENSNQASSVLQTAFLLTNNESGETHVIVTNKSGKASTSINVGGMDYTKDEKGILYPEHTRRTNINDRLYFASTVNPDGTLTIDYTRTIYNPNKPIDVSQFDEKAGVWFGLSEDGVMSVPNDALCALPWGEYTITELRTTTNVGLDLITDTLNLRNYKIDPEEEVVGGDMIDTGFTLPTVRKSVSSTTVNEGIDAYLYAQEKYSYKLSVTATGDDIKDLVLTDFIEQAGSSDIIGTITGINTQAAEQMGFKPSFAFTNKTREEATSSDDWKDELGNKTRGVRIGLQGTLRKGETVYVDVFMNAPNPKQHLKSYNYYTLNYKRLIHVPGSEDDALPNIPSADPSNPDGSGTTGNTSVFEDPAEPIDSNTTSVEIGPKEESTPKPPVFKKTLIDKHGQESNKITAYAGDPYSYRLRIDATETALTNIVITDMVEQNGTEKLGYIVGVNTAYATQKGFTASVAYTAKTNPTAADWTNDITAAQGVKVALQGTLGKGESVYVDIVMKAPEIEKKDSARYVFTLGYTKINPDGSEEPGGSLSSDDPTSNPVKVVVIHSDEPSLVKEVITKSTTGTKASLSAQEEYRYRLNVTAGGSDIKNLIITDFIEQDESAQLGTIVGVDTTAAKKKGFTATVKYTNVNVAKPIWTKTNNGAVGVQITLKGTLKAKKSTYVEVLMKAPVADAAKVANNRFTLDYTKIGSDGQSGKGDTVTSNKTVVDIQAGNGNGDGTGGNGRNGNSPVKTGDASIPLAAAGIGAILGIIAYILRKKRA